MEILLVIVIVMVAFMGWGWIESGKLEEEHRKKGYIDIICGKYIYGLKDQIAGVEIMLITTRNKGIKMSLPNKYNYKCIPYEDMKDYRIINETQMQQDITMGKLFTLGILALGTSKKRMEVESYFSICYFDKEENENVTLLIKPETNECALTMYGYIKKAMDMYKNGELECSKQN